VARSLATLTGAPVVAAPSDVPPVDDLRAEAPLAAWLSGAEETPAVVVARQRVRAQDAVAAQQRAALLPTLSAQATERATNAAGFGTSPYYSVGFVVTWKLDAATYTSSRVSDAATRTAQVRAERAAADARDAIFDAWHDVAAQIAKCSAARAQREASRQALGIAAQKYAAGTGTQLDVILARRDDFSAEVTSLQADADLAAARATLRLVSGRSLAARGPS
jgi:outer membrane protein TolC